MKFNTNTGDAEGTPEEIVKLKQLLNTRPELTPSKQPKRTRCWTDEETSRLKMLYQSHGSSKKILKREFPTKTWGQIYNKIHNDNMPREISLVSNTIKRKESTRTRWSEEEIKVLKHEYNKDLSVPIDWVILEGRLPTKTKLDIQKKASNLKLTKRGRAREVKTGWARQPCERSKFVGERIQNYYKQGFKPNEAFKAACNDWDKRQGNIKIPTQTQLPENFPNFETINGENALKLLEDMTKHIIANKGILSYVNDGYALGIQDGRGWKSFVVEFLNKKKQVADYFGVEDSFQYYQNQGKYDEIHYKPQKYGGV